MITAVQLAHVRARAVLDDRRRRIVAAIPPYARLQAAAAVRDGAAALHDALEAVHDRVIGPLYGAAHDAWVTAGRHWERSLGLPDDHPDALFLAADGPHLNDEPCNCTDSDGGDPDWGDVSDVTV